MDASTSGRGRTIGAFVAGLSLAIVGAFAVQTFTAGATGDESQESSLVAMTSCRLVDTRPNWSIGPNSTFGSDDTKTVPSINRNSPARSRA